MTEERKEKGKEEKAERRHFRVYFTRLFEKYDIRNQEKFIRFCKWLIFIVLITLETLTLLQCFGEAFIKQDWNDVLSIGIIQAVLTLCVGLRLFVVKRQSVTSIILYVLNALSVFGFMLIAENSVIIIVYMLFLTEFYIDASKPKLSFYWICFSIPCYIGIYMVRLFLLNNVMPTLMQAIAQSVGNVFALVVHFVVVNVALAFYRQFLRLEKTLKELDESKQELEKAYEAVAEVTALEERQRIAKEIHDTAGHSLTTVIMQTEAAKRIMDSDPEDEKVKIVTANLRAKHALAELRDSVHLFSGYTQQQTLKMSLLDIIHDSTDGTGIVIRYEIADVEVSSAKHRFLCNTLKEGISNGLRHGDATAFWFELKEENGKLYFTLSDNGIGADVVDLQEGFGLTTMRERAVAFGGEVQLTTEKENGFEIGIVLPIDKKEGGMYATKD